MIIKTSPMQCDRLIKMIKSWYLHVRDETMAPARMVSFMQKHAKTCEVCLADPDLKEEIAKITELILPESKIPKAVRQQNMRDQEAEDDDDLEDDDDANEEDDDLDDDGDDDDLDDDDELDDDDDELDDDFDDIDDDDDDDFK